MEGNIVGAADDIKEGLTKTLGPFTKQMKAEERRYGAGRWRAARLTKIRVMPLTEAAFQVMEQCYLKVSDNGSLPAMARQMFYAAKPLIQKLTERPLEYGYFSQTLLPDYVKEHGQDWDIVYDDRGHFTEPHSKHQIGLGTLNVREYLSRIRLLKLQEADFDPAAISTYGPDGQFGALLYIEKEGFTPLFNRVKLAKRYDLGIMSSKGMSVTAARQLAEGICARYRIPLLILHDFDRSGAIIKHTLHTDTRRYVFTQEFRVIDFGLTFDDIGGLEKEDRGKSNISDERLSEAGLSEEAIAFLEKEKVELNAYQKDHS
jgi:hypothetical protein